MLNLILEFSVRQRLLVLIGAFCLLAVGLFSLLQLPIDAVPDLTGPQVQVNVSVPALAPEESERAVTARSKWRSAACPESSTPDPSPSSASVR